MKEKFLPVILLNGFGTILLPLLKLCFLLKKHYTYYKAYRVWGYYEVLLHEKGYKIKKICVKPFCKLSIQSHNERAEHWIVVKGIATIIIENKKTILTKGEFVMISPNTKHQLLNNTKNNIIVIETQLGNYLEEDDIVRYLEF